MYTFDVFDTLITRKTATPEGIFALIQKKIQRNKEYLGFSEYIKNNFYHLRINAEVLARYTYCAVGGAEDITLEQIYEAMSMTGSVAGEEVQKLISLEKETELENVVGINININKIKQLIASGEHVVLISDMYLDKQTIQEMLIKTDSVFKYINLYVSSEYKKSKWSGNLYKIVKTNEKAEYKNWIHCGDNKISDIKSAEKFGIKTQLFDFEAFIECEKEIIKNNKENLFVQLTIGSTRNVRLNENLAGPAAIGASVGAVILFPYVWWILQESLRKGIKRLYFIARDGFVLKEIADIIIEKHKYNISTYYIYGSRLAWRIPSFSKKNNDLFKLMRWSYASKIKDVKALAEFLEIPVEDLKSFLPESLKNKDIKLTEPFIALLMKKLNDNNEFKKYFKEAHKEKRELVVEYLKQEIDITDDNFAFVDLAGGGLTQGCMADLMSDFYDKKIRNFFFKLDQMNVMNNCIYYDFIPSFLHLSLIIEMLCRAPHGQTMRYCRENDKIVPVLKQDEGEALVKHGFNEYLNGIKKITEYYALILRNNYIQGDNLELLLKYMEYITKTPDKEILDFFGGMPNSVSGREKEIIEFAPRLSKKEICSIFLFRTNEPLENYYKGSSLEYSVLRATEEEKRKIEYYKKHNNLFLGNLVRMFQKIISKKELYGLAANFPCEMLGEQVVLYGAGKLGKDLYRKINHSSNSHIVMWVDKNYKEYRKKVYKVVDPDEICNVEYDNIIIGVLNKELSESIREELIGRGIPNEKILWINLNKIWL
ncbi:hypothetical protein [Clostridium sp. BL-8]|uniref:HAD family hydrolase n=1 Tax=Clostridium sp. BL-8 TaxID=349938 RepID=UPI00098C8E27|nr:hypothetical protein [Clostridium sp. BL-8]OOM79954.1 hypothetical protein CLOBL_13220 [Clostridium sp. BL-8]